MLFTSRQRNLDEYFLAGRSMGSVIIAMTILASLFSGISFLAAPSEGYANGPIYFLVNLGFFVATPLTTVVFLPFYYNARFFTAYQYLEERFGGLLRTLASFSFIARVLLWLAAATYPPALALEQATGMPLWFTILCTGALTTIYTAFGGMRAVIWTDVMQLIVLFGGQLAIVLVAVGRVPGGWGQVVDLADQGGRLDISFSPDPTVRLTLWGLLIGSAFMHLVQMATDQVSVQRYISASSLRVAQRGLWLKLWLVLPVTAVFYGAGLVLYAFYQVHGDPLATGKISRPDQILPYFVMNELPHGLPGLFIAAIFAASMSTISSGINSLTSASLVDFYQRLWRRPDLSEKKQLSIARTLTFAYGALVIMLAFLVQRLGTLLEATNKVIGLIGGPLIGLFSPRHSDSARHGAWRSDRLDWRIAGHHLGLLRHVHFIPLVRNDGLYCDHGHRLCCQPLYATTRSQPAEGLNLVGATGSQRIHAMNTPLQRGCAFADYCGSFIRRARSAILATTLMIPVSVADAATSTWERLAPLPVSNGGFLSGVIDGKIVIAGGTTWKDDTKLWLDRIWAYDPNRNQWREAGRLPSALAYPVSAHDGRTVWFASGSSGTRTDQGLWRMDTAGMPKRVAKIEDAFVYASGGIIGSNLYVVGGTDDQGKIDRVTNTFRAIDVSTGKITPLANYPETGLTTGTAAVMGERLFVFGGARWDAQRATVVNHGTAHVYSVAQKSWRALPPLPHATRGLTAIVLDGRRIYLAGGYRNDEVEFVADAYLFDVQTQTYTPTTPLPYAGMVSLVTVGDWLYCVGGEDRKRHRSDAVFRIRWKTLAGSQ